MCLFDMKTSRKAVKFVMPLYRIRKKEATGLTAIVNAKLKCHLFPQRENVTFLGLVWWGGCG